MCSDLSVILGLIGILVSMTVWLDSKFIKSLLSSNLKPYFWTFFELVTFDSFIYWLMNSSSFASNLSVLMFGGTVCAVVGSKSTLSELSAHDSTKSFEALNFSVESFDFSPLITRFLEPKAKLRQF